MAKKTEVTETAAQDTRHLVVVVKGPTKATVTSTSLPGWIKLGWKRLDDKAGA